MRDCRRRAGHAGRDCRGVRDDRSGAGESGIIWPITPPQRPQHGDRGSHGTNTDMNHSAFSERVFPYSCVIRDNPRSLCFGSGRPFAVATGPVANVKEELVVARLPMTSRPRLPRSLRRSRRSVSRRQVGHQLADNATATATTGRPRISRNQHGYEPQRVVFLFVRYP